MRPAPPARRPGERTMRATRGVRLAAATLALAASASVTALAYNDDPAADSVFPSWYPTEPVSRPLGLPTGAVFCELRRLGPHFGEVHFRNVSKVSWHLDFWIEGHQRPGDNARITVAPSFPAGSEVRVPVRLRHGRPGYGVRRVWIHDLRLGALDEGPVQAPLVPRAAEAFPDADWMPVRPFYDDEVVRRSQLQARVRTQDGRTSLEFLNSSFRDLHFAFEVPALGWPKSEGPRVRVPAGGRTLVPLQRKAAAPAPQRRVPVALVSVFVADLRTGPEDTGYLHAEDLRAYEGWFALTTSDDSDRIPRDRVLYAVTAEPGARRARVRFLNRLASEATLAFRIPGFHAEPVAATLPPGRETSLAIDLDRPADARLSLTRPRVERVKHGDEQ